MNLFSSCFLFLYIAIDMFKKFPITVGPKFSIFNAPVYHCLFPPYCFNYLLNWICYGENVALTILMWFFLSPEELIWLTMSRELQWISNDGHWCHVDFIFFWKMLLICREKEHGHAHEHVCNCGAGWCTERISSRLTLSAKPRVGLDLMNPNQALSWHSESQDN